MELGERGENLIKSYEKLRLEAYMPTPDDRPTIGWGHTKGVKMGDRCTEEQAEKWFMEDVADAVEDVNKLVRLVYGRARLTQSMFDALVSLVYNAGGGAVAEGNGIYLCLSREDYYQACATMFEYRKQTNRTTKKKENVRGLALRRAREMALFLEDRF